MIVFNDHLILKTQTTAWQRTQLAWLCGKIKGPRRGTAKLRSNAYLDTNELRRSPSLCGSEWSI